MQGDNTGDGVAIAFAALASLPLVLAAASYGASRLQRLRLARGLAFFGMAFGAVVALLVLTLIWFSGREAGGRSLLRCLMDIFRDASGENAAGLAMLVVGPAGLVLSWLAYSAAVRRAAATGTD